MASRWAVVSTKSGFVSKHASLHVAVQTAARPILVPHFVAIWCGTTSWTPISEDETIEGERIFRTTPGGYTSTAGPRRPLWPMIDAIRVERGYEPMTYADYRSLVEAAHARYL